MTSAEARKAAKREYNRRYYAAHRDQLTARQRQYGATHREEQARYCRDHREQRAETNRRFRAKNPAYQKAWSEANREKVRGYSARYRGANLTKERTRVRATARRWRKADPKRWLASAQRYRDANREKVRESSRRHYAGHREEACENNHRRRAREVGAPGSGWTARDVKAQYKAQRGRCLYCKGQLGKGYHRDHIMPLAKGGAHCRSNLALACRTCNLRKRDKDPQVFAGILL